MTAVLGYFLCLAALFPALSLDVFFGLLGKTSRLHDVLVLIRTLVQMLATVTSPFRIMLTLTVMLCAVIIEAEGPRRGIGFLLLGLMGIAGMLPLAPLDLTEAGAAIALFPAALASLASFSCTARLMVTDAIG